MKTYTLSFFVLILMTCFSGNTHAQNSLNYVIPKGKLIEVHEYGCSPDGCGEFFYTTTKTDKCFIVSDLDKSQSINKDNYTTEDILLTSDLSRVKQHVDLQEQAKCLKVNKHNNKLCELVERKYTWKQRVSYKMTSMRGEEFAISCHLETYSAPPKELSDAYLVDLFRKI